MKLRRIVLKTLVSNTQRSRTSFLAFNRYDRATRLFVSRDVLESGLRRSAIQLTPMINFGDKIGEAVMLRMIQQPSSYSDDRMEGSYVKLEDDDKVAERQAWIFKNLKVLSDH